MARVAVIDTGTNSTRLLVADVAGETVREIVRQTTITRLGEGVDKSGRLASPARERVLECLVRYAATAGEVGVERGLIIATSSVRDAADGEEFLRSLAEVSSYDYRILTGEEEAALSFTGAAMDIDEASRVMLFDVGGGSTEVVIGRRRQVEFAASMNLGCVRLKERFLFADPVSPAEIKNAAAYVDNELQKSVSREALAGIEQAIAVAGTVTTLAAVDLGLESYDRELVHGHVLTQARVDSLLDMFSAMNIRQRLQIPVLEAGRADVIVAGALIVSRLLDFTGVPEFTVSEHDILDGAALAMAGGQL